MRRRIKTAAAAAVLALLLAGCAGGGGAGEPVQVWVTTPDKSKLLERQADLRWAKDGGGAAAVAVDEKTVYQPIDGFGAALTDSSAWLIASELDAAARETLMRKLFDREEGIGISYLRLPMGASDFALEPYSYNDLPEGETDPEQSKFSIKHDEAYIIPTLREAKAINPELKLMGSPWSAPGWMKTSGSMIGGSLKFEYYASYADYFVKFVKAYEEAGLPIDAVTPQNEPHHVPADYPGMRMEAFEQAEWIKNHLGPAFERSGIGTKIVIWDHNWDETYYPMTVLNDPDAAKHIAGSAFHGYAGDVSGQSKVKEAFPDKDIYFTESSGGEWAPDFGGSLKWDMQQLIIGATRNWARTVLKWNLALDENHGPTIGGCRDCRGVVTIDTGSGEVAYNEEYYAIGHASKFVRPGARRIDSGAIADGGIDHVAFANPDGSLALVAFNGAEEARVLTVRWKGRSFAYELPAGAAATFVWQGEPAAS